MNRREMLRLALLAAGGAYGASRLPALAQTPLPQPRSLEVRRAAGVVEAQVTARTSNLTINGQPVRLLTYGSFPGPTLRVREGELVRLNFTNSLPEVTNLHLHGLHIPPEVDAPLEGVHPGQSRLYEFTIPRGSAGTYWYHPHIHGKVARQLYSGLAGLLIVEGPLDAMDELKQAEEHTLVLKDWVFVNGQIPRWTHMDWMNGREGSLLTVNAAVRPVLRAQKPTLRLRLLNASNARYYRLAVENHPLYLIATDAGFIEKPVELSELLLAPGERAEVLVRFSRAGSFRLQALPYDRGAMGMPGMMMGGPGMGPMGMPGMMGDAEMMGDECMCAMDQSGMPHGGMNQERMPMGSTPGRMMGRGATPLQTLLTITAPASPRPLPLPTSLASVERLNPGQAATTRRIVFGERMMQAQFFFNNQLFDPNRVDIRARLGTLEVWELVNQSDMDHPFHLHIYPFQVLSHNGRPSLLRAWKDTVNLRKDDVVRLAVPLRNFAGSTLYHCHIPEHEDRGMMGTLLVEG